jgi:hypothetical protein
MKMLSIADAAQNADTLRSALLSVDTTHHQQL